MVDFIKIFLQTHLCQFENCSLFYGKNLMLHLIMYIMLHYLLEK